jgi:hypothetical protein
MDLIIGPADVCEDGQLLAVLVEQYGVVRRAVLVEQYGVVRRNESVVMEAHQDSPRVFADEPAGDLGIVDEMVRVMTHVESPSLSESAPTAPNAAREA